MNHICNEKKDFIDITLYPEELVFQLIEFKKANNFLNYNEIKIKENIKNLNFHNLTKNGKNYINGNYN